MNATDFSKVTFSAFVRSFIGYFICLKGLLLLVLALVALLLVGALVGLLALLFGPGLLVLFQSVMLAVSPLMPLLVVASILMSIWTVERREASAVVGAPGSSQRRWYTAAVRLGEFLAGAVLCVLVVSLLALLGLAVLVLWRIPVSSGTFLPVLGLRLVTGLVVLAIGVNTTFASRAVFKRDFMSYFANPTGYVFICVFVWLSVLAAFWTNDFFNANLANLDQLNKVFPFIMLVFVPAITMSVWAEERRQGTDELLLTIPAGDRDIVLGKYLAAMAIYSVSLLFSALCTFTVLRMLGEPDVGLLQGTYFGYWLVGLAMLAVGTVASFLTRNLTVAFVLGALFNVPLVFATSEVLTVTIRAVISVPQWIVAVLDNMLLGMNENFTLLSNLHDELSAAVLNVPPRLSLLVSQWGVGGKFEEFGRGVVSLSGICYFLMIMAAMLYLSMVLIGRRHWRSGRLGASTYVSYPVLHLACILAFVFLWFLLRNAVSPFKLAVLLVGLYLLVQLGVILLWSLGRPRVALLPGHFITRFLALAATGLGVVLFFQHHDLRLDTTSERLNSLAPKTVELLENLEVKEPVRVEAFVSPESEIPETYVQARLNLINRLREMQAHGGEKIKLEIRDTERFTDAASGADKTYGITSREVRTTERGTLKAVQVFMGVAFKCGANNVVVPFIDRTIPIEYELVRSIATVTQQERKTVGVLATDANVYGGPMMGGGNWPIVGELEKQYEVEGVSADDLKDYNYLDRLEKRKPLEEKLEEAKKKLDELDKLDKLSDDQKKEESKLLEEVREIEGKLDGDLKIYDVILAVQPSSLGPEQMDQFVAAVRTGQPTAIFEDPCPLFAQWVPGTTEPKRPPRQMMPMMRQQNLPKGDINRLWDLLGVEFNPGEVIRQDYNRYPKIEMFSDRKEFVFIGTGSGNPEAFNEQAAISKGLQNALFPFPGAIEERRAPHPEFGEDLEFTELLQTGTKTGTVRFRDLAMRHPFTQQLRLNSNVPTRKTNKAYTMAARIVAKAEGDGKGADQPEGKAEDKAGARRPALDVVVVTDIDMLTEAFFRMREQGEIEELGITFDFDNVTLVLNILDELAGDARFIDIRRHRAVHRTLIRIEERTEKRRDDTAKAREKLYKDFEKNEKREQAAFDKKIEAIRNDPNMPGQQKVIAEVLAERDGRRRLRARLDELKQERDKEVNRIETETAREIRRVQDTYKMWAVLLPPIPPLVVALVVYFTRRRREREGVSRSRLKP